MYVKVYELPESLINALKIVGYARQDIEIKVSETESLSNQGSDGYRAFAVVVDMSSGQSETLTGSWGGSNMFNPANRIDLDNKDRVLGSNVAVIKGTEGGTSGSVHASITIGPNNVVKALVTTEDVSLKEKNILYCYGALKPAYRKEELKRLGAVDSELDSLIERGYLKRDGRGITITTKGKNARSNSII